MPDLAGFGGVAAASTWLLTYLLHSTVVIAAVWCLVGTGRVRRPTTLDLLWKVALVAALATTSLAVLRPTRVISRQLAVEVRAAARDGSLAWRNAGAGPGLLRIGATARAPSPACRLAMDRLRADARAGTTALRDACRVRGGIPWRAYLVGVWLLGAAGLLTRSFLARLGLRRSLRDAYPAAEGPRLDARRLLPPTRRPVEVLVSRSTDAPCVVGGHIVLPARCVRDLTPDQIRAVLAHEVAHLVRRDPAWIEFGDLVCRALWLQPLHRLALERLRASAELACDDWAVDRTRHPLELARSIAKVAEWIHPRRGVPAPALGHLVHLARGEGRVLSERVRRIVTRGAVRSAAPRPLRLLLAALVVAPTLAVPAVPRTAAVYAVFIREEAGEGGSTPSTEMRAEDVVVLVGTRAPARVAGCSPFSATC